MHQLRCELRRRRTAHRRRDGVATQRAGRHCGVGIFGHRRECKLQHLGPHAGCNKFCVLQCDASVRCKCFVFAVGERAPHAPLLMSRRRATDKSGTAMWRVCGFCCLPSSFDSDHCMGDRCCDFQQQQTDGVFLLIRVRCVSCAMHFVLGACCVRCDLVTRCVECDSMQRVHLRFTDVETKRDEKRKVEKNKRGEGTGQENKE